MDGHDDGDPLHPLTPREREVLELLRLGLTNGEIAGRLEITLDGAKYHVSEIISKLGVRDRHEAASYPERRSGWATALAPISFLWRQAGALVPVKASSVALVASAGLGAAALGGIGLIVFFLVQGGGGAVEAPAPVIRGLAPGEQAPDCVLRPDGSVIITAGRTLCFDPAQVTVGEVVRVTATKWDDEFPVEFYLLTEQQMALPGKELLDADLVRLGQLDLEGGEVSFAFTLGDSFETIRGSGLQVASGDRLFLMGYQRTNRASGSRATGPLVVR